jgi:hypothetical protein
VYNKGEHLLVKRILTYQSINILVVSSLFLPDTILVLSPQSGKAQLATGLHGKQTMCNGVTLYLSRITAQYL